MNLSLAQRSGKLSVSSLLAPCNEARVVQLILLAPQLLDIQSYSCRQEGSDSFLTYVHVELKSM